MTALDWTVLAATLVTIVAYGVWKSRNISDTTSYLKGDKTLRWYTVGLSVMATQASAITFLSTPGQAYDDGMRFVQFYFGLPLAMVVISAFMVPMYYRLNVFTAYEYLEKRFDVRVRLLTAFLFLVSRGLAAGITIYAPAIILSSLLGWSLEITNVIIGVVVIVYTVLGGTQAVSQTQKQQMIVIMTGMVVAGLIVVAKLPTDVSLSDAARIAGALGRMDVVDFSFDLKDRYNLWSGLTGGFFLALAYFGTDQSQVQRYIASQSLTQSRLGLLFNGIFKVPMQFGILFIGVLVFVYYVFVQPPAFFNQAAVESVRGSAEHAAALQEAEQRYHDAHTAQRIAAESFLQTDDSTALKSAHQDLQAARQAVKDVVKAAKPETESEDADYVFITFVINTLPAGLVGLLIAVILSAAMSSTASELNALGTTSMVDFYRRVIRPEADDKHYLRASKLLTVFWGGLALAFATFASLLDNLIEAVNILGSIFYGPILGIFLVAFFLKRIGSRAVLVGAVVGQAAVLACFAYSDVGFLWFNLVGCAVVMAVAAVAALALPQEAPTQPGV
ncbi:MAG: sodium:solute symporter [Myxococcota bacterium]